MLRLHLPPNFAAAVVRNAVPLRVELDLSTPPPVPLLPVLALLQRWCGTPTPPKFIQLNRAQLRELAAAAGTQAVFVEEGKATWWRHEGLLGRHEAESSGITVPRSADKPARVTPPARSPSRTGIVFATPQSRSFGASDGATRLTIDGSEHFLAITLPSREHALYESVLALLKENGFALEPSNRKWWLRDRHKVLNFLASNLAALQDRFGADLTPSFEKNTAHIRAAEIATDVGMTGGGFSVSVGVRAGDTDPNTLRSAIASNRGYVETGGRIFLLDNAKLQKVAAAQRALAGDPNAGIAPQRSVMVPSARTAEVQDILEQLSPNFQAPAAWRERSAALRNLTQLIPAPVTLSVEALLRPYQKLGVAWLWHLYRHELGGILADEMGLGKTLQALALLGAAKSARDGVSASTKPTARRPSATPAPTVALVVCPASLLENWRREAIRFAPELRVFVHHGENRLAQPSDFNRYDLIVTSYGTLTRDQTLFTSVPLACAIADEAQHIKNRRSQNAAALRALDARTRFLLTGTPVENSLDDLRSLFEFLLPGYLNRVPTGLTPEERSWHNDRLRAQTAPYILRRTKQAVAPELPEKIEQVVWCELTAAQATLYRETQERSEREMIDLEASGASEGKLKFAALTQLLRLRQICCDPRLILRKPAEDSSESTTALGNSPAATKKSEPPYGDSAKLDAFRELLEEAVDDGHRVLVFSQFTSLLGLLRTELDRREVPHCYLDGSMSARARQAEVDRFQDSEDIPLFLLSLKAGGTGLNLTGADTVVIFDPWWNPAAEAQATDRAHRIGQTRTVTSYKLIAAGTVEEKVLALQAEKRALLADVFEASDTLAAKLTITDLRDLMH